MLGPIGLTLSHNSGVAFGLASGGGTRLVVVTALALAVVGYVFARNPTRPGMWVAAGLLAGGALGNLADRVRADAVTDYIQIGSWPAFNLADVAVTAGRPVAGSGLCARAGVVSGAGAVAARSCGSFTSTRRSRWSTSPPGLVVHPAPSRRGPTLVDELGELLGGGADPERPGIVHRLDKGTSGLLVVARRDEAHAALQAQVQRREVERIYLALARGRLASRTGTIDAPIGRASRQRHRMAVSGAASRQARTHFRCSSCSAPRPTSRPGWRPAAPTRSAPTSPRSATRWSATPPTAASASTASSASSSTPTGSPSTTRSAVSG